MSDWRCMTVVRLSHGAGCSRTRLEADWIVSRTVGRLSGPQIAHVTGHSRRLAADYKLDRIALSMAFGASFPIPERADIAIPAALSTPIDASGHMEDDARPREGTRMCSLRTDSEPYVFLLVGFHTSRLHSG